MKLMEINPDQRGLISPRIVWATSTILRWRTLPTRWILEQMMISQEACDLVNKTKLAGHRVCAIGTSVMKATETL